MPAIKVENITKTFEDSIAIKDISFTLEEGRLVSLLGPSGSGKTTILRLIAGLIEPDQGQIFVDEINISKVPTEERNIGFVFQSYALFPHLTVAENIAFGLETRRWPKKEIIDRVKEILILVGLDGKGMRFPRELSGGEKSRVALARALAPKPSLLLLDEPLSALDQSLKENLRHVIREIQQRVNVTTLYVTHDQKEAMEISDSIIILNNGEIVEIGTPKNLYLSPKKRFSAEFLGICNIFEGILVKEKYTNVFSGAFGSLEVNQFDQTLENTKVAIAIFPEHIEVSQQKKGTKNEFPAIVLNYSFGGARETIIVDINGVKITLYKTSTKGLPNFKTGETIFIEIPKKSIVILED